MFSGLCTILTVAIRTKDYCYFLKEKFKISSAALPSFLDPNLRQLVHFNRRLTDSACGQEMTFICPSMRHSHAGSTIPKSSVSTRKASEFKHGFIMGGPIGQDRLRRGYKLV